MDQEEANVSFLMKEHKSTKFVRERSTGENIFDAERHCFKKSKDFQSNAFFQIKMMRVSILLNNIVVPLLSVFTNFCYLFAIQIHQHLGILYKFAILFEDWTCVCSFMLYFC